MHRCKLLREKQNRDDKPSLRARGHPPTVPTHSSARTHTYHVYSYSFPEPTYTSCLFPDLYWNGLENNTVTMNAQRRVLYPWFKKVIYMSGWSFGLHETIKTLLLQLRQRVRAGLSSPCAMAIKLCSLHLVLATSNTAPGSLGIYFTPSSIGQSAKATTLQSTP